MITHGPGVTTLLAVRDESQIADARRRMATFIHDVDFDEESRGRVSIIVTELATNLLRHAQGGELFCRLLPEHGGVELIASDRGPGMADVRECMRDGFSTNGTSGNGLGAISRLSSGFDIFSVPGKGTVVLSQVLARPDTSRPRFVVGMVCLPVGGESECGDDWLVQDSGARMRMIVADGLGHGPDAASASRMAISSCSESRDAPPGRVIEQAHRAIASSRGAAVAVCDIDTDRSSVTFCGVGNIAGVVIGGHQRSMISHNGIVGHQQRKVQEFNYPWAVGSLVILHSDGIQSRWILDDYPGLRARHPAVIAAVLHRDFNRGRDDVCIVVVKEDR